jgi:hypothetical protein
VVPRLPHGSPFVVDRDRPRRRAAVEATVMGRGRRVQLGVDECSTGCRALVEAIPWGGGAPPARPGIWLGRGARCRWFNLRRPGRWVDRRSARHRADHPRSRRSCAPGLPRDRAERGAGIGEGREAATAACCRSRSAATASPLAAPTRLRQGPPRSAERVFCCSRKSHRTSLTTLYSSHCGTFGVVRLALSRGSDCA